jgi:hypothetical protein
MYFVGFYSGGRVGALFQFRIYFNAITLYSLLRATFFFCFFVYKLVIM